MEAEAARQIREVFTFYSVLLRMGFTVEAIPIIQARDNSGLDHGGNKGDTEKRLDSSYILEESQQSILINGSEYLRKGSFPGGSVVKNSSANAGDAGDVYLIPESERSPGGGNGNSL